MENKEYNDFAEKWEDFLSLVKKHQNYLEARIENSKIMRNRFSKIKADPNSPWSEIQILCGSGTLSSPKEINLTWYDRCDFTEMRKYVRGICLRGNDKAETRLPAIITTVDGYQYSLSDLHLLPLLEKRQLGFLSYLQNDGSSLELVIEDPDGYSQVIGSVGAAIKHLN